nr:recombinase family protein [Jatrophihabitans sp. DSM 44399]
MGGLLIGYARVSTVEQDLTAQRDGLARLGVEASRVYVDHGLTGTNRARPGLREAMAACRAGDTLTVTKLDRLARSLPDARDIVDELTRRGGKLNLGGSVHDPGDPVGRLLFNVLAMVAEFESDLIRMRTREGMAVAKAKGRLRGKQPKLSPSQERHLVDLHRAGAHTGAELAELFNVARSTVYRAVTRAGVPPTITAVVGSRAEVPAAGDRHAGHRLKGEVTGELDQTQTPAPVQLVTGQGQTASTGQIVPQSRPAKGSAGKPAARKHSRGNAAPFDATAARRRLGILRGGIRDLTEDWASTEQLIRHLYARQVATDPGPDAVAIALGLLEEALRGSTPVPVGIPRTTDPTELRTLLRTAERDYERLLRDHLTRAAQTLTTARS